MIFDPRPSHVCCAYLLTELSLSLPLASYRKGFARDHSFLLDGQSAPQQAPHLADFALFGAEPRFWFRASRGAPKPDGSRGGRICLQAAGGAPVEEEGDPFAALAELLRVRAASREPPESPLPFRAGLVGYVAYEAGQMLERLPCLPRPRRAMPDVAFGYYGWVIGYDKRQKKTWLSVVGEGPTEESAAVDAARLRDAVCERLRWVEVNIALPTHAIKTARAFPGCEDVTPCSSASETEYVDSVRRAQRHIDAGDAFEICLTRMLGVPYTGDPWDLFSTLSRTNPAPFAALLDLPEGAIVSSSLELFLRVRGREVETRPIKGTTRRSPSTEADQRAREGLAHSEKDRAEHLMIVDLMRNDLSRVCQIGTVRVPQLCAVESYATVHHLVSSVCGELHVRHGSLDLLRACFPPGSMTGAPKIAAMTILETLEAVERGPYAGALGYLDVWGDMTLSVLIRTVVLEGAMVWVGTGGAVVADSEAHAEYDETVTKAEALLSALSATQNRSAPR